MRPKSSKSSIEEEEETASVREKTAEDSCRATLLSLTSFSACLGFILFLTGCIITSYYNAFIDFITGRYTEGSIFLIVIGLVVIAVSGLGQLNLGKYGGKFSLSFQDSTLQSGPTTS